MQPLRKTFAWETLPFYKIVSTVFKSPFWRGFSALPIKLLFCKLQHTISEHSIEYWSFLASGHFLFLKVRGDGDEIEALVQSSALPSTITNQDCQVSSLVSNINAVWVNNEYKYSWFYINDLKFTIKTRLA